MTRMTLANLTRGRLVKPQKIVLYGVDGVGKSSWAAQAPKPIFLCAEEGTEELDVTRLPSPHNWQEVREALLLLINEDHGCQTLVVDSLDWLEPLIWDQVAHQERWRDVADGEYNAGYKKALGVWREFLRMLDELHRQGMHVILIAHSKVAKHQDLGGQDWDRYSLKLCDGRNADAAALVREWARCVLFARFDEKRGGKGQGFGKWDRKGVSSGQRLLHTTRTAAWDAKNRASLPPTLPLDWQAFAKVALSADVTSEDRDRVRELLEHLQDGEKATKAGMAIKQAKTRQDLGRIEERVRQLLEEQAEQRQAEPENTPSETVSGGSSTSREPGGDSQIHTDVRPPARTSAGRDL